MFCSQCGEKLAKDDSYCWSCGTFTEDIGARTSGNKQDALGSYLSGLPSYRTKAWRKPTEKKSRYRKPVFVVLVIALVAGGLFVINQGYTSSFINIFPVIPTGEKTVALTCDYGDRNLGVDLTLYSNIDQYYQNQIVQKKGYLSSEEYASFVYSNPQDPTIKDLATKIRGIATANQLEGDQTLELAMCFVQNIPYDDAYGAEVLARGGGNIPQKEQYPYETLFKDTGICTSKTYLGSALARELGYGTGIITLPKAEHMALGISVPSAYTSFGSKYAYVEMTAVEPPGLIPDSIDATTGLPITSIQKLDQLTDKSNPDTITGESAQSIQSALSIVDVNTGASYERIVAVNNLKEKIAVQITDLVSRKADLKKAYSSISYWDSAQARAYSSYEAMPSSTETCTEYSYSGAQCYSSPNYSKSSQYNTYSNYFDNYKEATRNYNALVDDYNTALDNVNTNIDLYKSFDYR